MCNLPEYITSCSNSTKKKENNLIKIMLSSRKVNGGRMLIYQVERELRINIWCFILGPNNDNHTRGNQKAK